MGTPLDFTTIRRQKHRDEMHTRLRAMASYFRANDPPYQFAQELMGWVDTVSEMLDELQRPVDEVAVKRRIKALANGKLEDEEPEPA